VFPLSVISAASEFESTPSISLVDLVKRADIADGNGGALAAGVSIEAREHARLPRDREQMAIPPAPAASESWII
jgi:hypothetical protein